VTEAELIMKKEEIRELLAEVFLPVLQFFDRDSSQMLDEKIEVLKALKSGKTIEEIPNFYRVLELMPKDGMWDC
jgi:hypothetical protein